MQKDYFLFSEPPTVNQNIDILVNCWVMFPRVPSQNGFVSFSFTDNCYGYWGTPLQCVAPGVIVSSGQAVPVTLGPNKGTSLTFDASVPNFVNPPSVSNVENGFTVISQNDFNSPSPYVFGLAKISNTGIPAPVATFQAEPGNRYNIFLVTKFYVGSGKIFPGQIIDVQQIGNTQEIDFTGTPYNNVVVINKSNGTYDIRYGNFSNEENEDHIAQGERGYVLKHMKPLYDDNL